jgi:hypothetical protein
MPKPPTEASRNLSQDEIPYQRVDFRHFRSRSNRTAIFACKISPELDQAIRHLALQENRMIVEIFEEALTIYLKNKGININNKNDNIERERAKSRGNLRKIKASTTQK